MSSNEDEGNNEGEGLSPQGLKKRRIQRACDICRRKKIRCDGVQMPGNRCSNCVSYSLDCTYVEASKKRGPPKGYVENLENRVEKLDKLLRKLLPDPTLLKEFQDSMDKDRAPFNPSPLVASATQQHQGPPTNSVDPLTSAIRGTSENFSPPGDIGDVETSILCDNLKRLALSPSEYRFFGKSSGAMLVEAAVKLKEEYAQTLEPAIRSSETPNFSSSRSEFWVLQEWERSSDKIFPQPPDYVFPEPDLALELVDLYFCNINLYLPLLHRPTFEKSVAKGLHHEDERFASTYLLVCAIGARFSDDPRVLLDGDDTHHSSGWKWFNQVQMVKKSFLSLPSVYDLQFYCLSVHFLQGSSFPQSCWTMVGIGIRLAQDVAAHRRKVHQQNLTAEDELWKRGFWVLICMDRSISAALGRPCAIHDDDFDVDLPVECDDEYWDHPDPEQRFKQPENKPSLITAFILSIKLYQVLSYCLRTIYAINKSKILFGYVGQHWEQHIVAELDSALNKWVDSMPDHLRWDPTREGNHFKQSASLYALYYHIQILIHRPFIPTPTKPSPLSFPSLAICTNAARSCSHIAEIQRRKNPFPPLHCTMAIFSAGIVLLLSIWGGKRSGLSMDPNKEMTDVHKCMKALKMYEGRWRSIGRLWDILCELAEAGDLPLPQPSPLSMNKREWDCDTPRSAASSESPQPMVQDDSPRIMAGSRRVNKDLASGSKRAGQSQQQSNQQQPPNQPQRHASTTSHLRQSNSNRPHSDRSVTSSVPSTSTFSLPVYSDELGRLPLHGHPNNPAQSYVDQANYWYQSVPNNGGTSGGQHPQTQDQLRSSHNNNTNNYSPGTNSITQGFSFNPTMGTEHIMFDPISLPYIPPASYGGVSQPTEIVSSQNPVGRPSQPPDFRGVSMALRNDLSGVLDRRQESSQPPSHLEHPHHQHHHHYTQGPGEHDVHNNHQHREQPPPMGYSYEYNDTMAMWSTAPTGFELDEWGTYLSNMSGQQQER